MLPFSFNTTSRSAFTVAVLLDSEAVRTDLTEASPAHIYTGESITPLSVSALIVASLGTGIDLSFLSIITLNIYFKNSKQVRDYMGAGIFNAIVERLEQILSLRKYQPMNT